MELSQPNKHFVYGSSTSKLKSANPNEELSFHSVAKRGSFASRRLRIARANKSFLLHYINLFET